MRTGGTCVSRNQRDMFWISWNIGGKLVYFRPNQIVKSTFCSVREDSNLGSCINFHRKPRRTNSSQGARAVSEVFCYHISQLCRGMTPTYHRAALNETLFERKRFPGQMSCLSSQDKRTKSEPRRLDTTTVHHQSSRHLSRFRLPVLQIQLSERNFFQTQDVCRQLHQSPSAAA